jgi:hypothetical protein
MVVEQYRGIGRGISRDLILFVFVLPCLSVTSAHYLTLNSWLFIRSFARPQINQTIDLNSFSLT